MKYILTIFLTLIVLTSGMAQTVRRVNNGSGITGTNVYTTLQAAHDAASANDIIIVEPITGSGTYGDLTATKPLKIYGNGYFLDVNTELKKDTRESDVGTIYFNTNSGGSEIYGIYAPSISIHGVSNVTVSRCYITGGVYIYTNSKTGSTHTAVTGTKITSNYLNLVTISIAAIVSNTIISNNIIDYMSTANDNYIQNWIVKNNTFRASGNTISLANTTFENNLVIGVRPLGFTNVNYTYNVFGNTGTDFNGNKFGYDVTENGDLQPAGTGISADELYQITKAGSTLKTASSSGEEVGAFGGSTPYIVSGIPAIPSITNFISTGSGDATTPIKVTISVKSNN